VKMQTAGAAVARAGAKFYVVNKVGVGQNSVDNDEWDNNEQYNCEGIRICR
jgi:energy-converting hydrogenase Eha subunit G